MISTPFTMKLDTTTVKQNTDLRELAGRYTTLHRESVRELAGPCPKCGGDDRFHVTATDFMCRQCHCRWGDAIEFVCWLDGVGFKEAVTKLGGNLAEAVPNDKRQPVTRPRVQQSSEWTKKAKHTADSAHERLVSPAGQAGVDYLLSRGLEPHTWQRFELGYRSDASLPGTWDSTTKQFIHSPQPAIVIPWRDEAGQVKAIRYRFLQQHEYIDTGGRQRREKLTAATGSQLAGQVYGWPGLLGGCEQLMTLLICEGELNALSCWQAQHDAGLDVLSLGSESQRLTPQMIARAQQYHRVIVWADREDVSRRMQQDIPGSQAFKSPEGQDANDLLQAGKLGAHLAGIRYKAAKTDNEREGLLWDLYDAASDDPGTIEAIAYIAKQLGKQVSVK